MGLSYVAIAASLMASLIVFVCLSREWRRPGKRRDKEEEKRKGQTGWAWQVRAMSSEEAPYSMANTASAIISPAPCKRPKRVRTETMKTMNQKKGEEEEEEEENKQ